MTLLVNNLSQNIPKVFLPFCQSDTKTKKTFRYHNRIESDSYTKSKAIIGSALGAAAAVGLIAKVQNVRFWKIEYGVKEIVGLAAAAITGGVAVGSIGATKEDKKEKCTEGIFQFLNAALPAGFVTGGLVLASNSTRYNTPIVKTAVTVLGLLLGMQLASNITNKVTDPKNKVPDRKLGFKDAIANIDDAVGVFAILKSKKIQSAADDIAETSSKKASSWLHKIPIENILPVIMAWCGYRAGQTN